MGFLRVFKAVATAGLSEVGGTAGRVAQGVLSGGASEVTKLVSDAHNTALKHIADGLDINLDKAGWLDPRRPVAFHADMHSAPREMLASAVNDVVNHHEELIRGSIEFVEGHPTRLASAVALRPLDMGVGNALLGGGMALSGVQMALGWEKPSRGLSDEEVRQLKMVFGETIDFSQVRINEGWAGVGSLNQKDRAFTTGNSIYLKVDKGDPKFERTLFHEMVHVWQFQHGGASYQSASLVRAQSGKADAYNWTDAVAQGKKWQDLNPEQQAKLIEDGWFSGVLGDPARTTGLGKDYAFINAELAAYIRAGWEELKAGRGAP
jgi:hypothetical protein